MSQSQGSTASGVKRKREKRRTPSDDIIKQFPIPIKGKHGLGDAAYLDIHEKIRDIVLPQTGWKVFSHSYQKSTYKAPVSNIWNCDLGKLVVPNVYIDTDLLVDLVQRYDVKARSFIDLNNQAILQINPTVITAIFQLWSGPGVPINFHKFAESFKREERLWRNSHMPGHRLRDRFNNLVMFTADEQGPYRYEIFRQYFVYTYFALCQALGRDCAPLMHNSLLYMALDIQGRTHNSHFSFAEYIARNIHSELVAVKVKKAPYTFKWYSLLMHMFLFVFREPLTEPMKLTCMSDDKELPVQTWTVILDRHSPQSTFVRFEATFVRNIRKMMGIPLYQRLSTSVLRFLRPMEYEKEKGINHNWGDFFYMDECTLIRIYGSTVAPHWLPLYVPDRVAFLEIFYQLNELNKAQFRGQGKASLLPPAFSFHGIEVYGAEGLNFTARILSEYKMVTGTEKVHDPEGFYADARQMVGRSRTSHTFHMYDLVRNVTEYTRYQTVKSRWDLFEKAEQVRKDNDPRYLGYFADCATGNLVLAKAERLFDNEAEFMEHCKLKGRLVPAQRNVPAPPTSPPATFIDLEEEGESDVPDVPELEVSKSQGIQEARGMDVRLVEYSVDVTDSEPGDEEVEQRFTSQMPKFDMAESSQARANIPQTMQELITADERIQDNILFLSNDSFIQTREFKEFYLMHETQRLLQEHLAAKGSADANEKRELASKAAQTVERNLPTLTPDEARAIVQASNMLFVPNWDITSSLALDVIRRQGDKAVVPSSDEEAQKMLFGSGFSPDLGTLAIWSIEPAQGRQIVESTGQFSVHAVIRNVEHTTQSQAADLVLNTAQLNKAVAEQSERKYKALLETLKKEREEKFSLQSLLDSKTQQASPSLPSTSSPTSTATDTRITQLKARLESEIQAAKDHESGVISALVDGILSDRIGACKGKAVELWTNFSSLRTSLDKNAQNLSVMREIGQTWNPRAMQLMRLRSAVAGEPIVKGKIESLLSNVEILQKMLSSAAGIDGRLKQYFKDFQGKNWDPIPPLLTSLEDMKGQESWLAELDKAFSQVRSNLFAEDITKSSFVSKAIEEILGIEKKIEQELSDLRGLMTQKHHQYFTVFENLKLIAWPSEEDYSYWVKAYLSDEYQEG